MERREFVSVVGGALAGWPDGRMVHPTIRASDPPDQEPSLPPEVFAHRLSRLQAELTTRKLDLLVAEPSTNFEYFTGHNPGRSERLILLLAPVTGTPAIVCPAFEVERVRRHSVIQDVRGWAEQENPWKLVRQAGREMKPPRRNGVAAVEPTTSYRSFLGLDDALGGWRFANGASVVERLRIVKSPEEVDLIRRAVAITEAGIAATFAQLTPDATEREVADVLARELATRGGTAGGGLVQFGPSSALPHGGPGGSTLARETVVLIDAGCRVGGYISDITRTIWYGDAPDDEFKKVFNLVHDAQTAALQLGRPFTTKCEDLDRTARQVITDAGYGQYFTHRLGHGMGMDGHEVPYLVEGNETRLESGMIFTIEPGIYQVGHLGVRIEDDCLMAEHGIEVLSHRPTKY
ncbi:MAG: aminopeptidase P family protein [Gemmatimonadetes bacterium]|nr:aminopeptidase P family protein [Gemmatimonadota bacterium]